MKDDPTPNADEQLTDDDLEAVVGGLGQISHRVLGEAGKSG